MIVRSEAATKGRNSDRPLLPSVRGVPDRDATQNVVTLRWTDADEEA